MARYPFKCRLSRSSIINLLIARRSYRAYLELGCQLNHNFDAVSRTVTRKVGVDNVEGGTHRMTTDEFFASNTEQFDIILIDASHHHDQVVKDLTNSFNVLMPGGVIVMHDCDPPSERYELPNACGTAWRAFCMFRQRPNLDMIVGQFDFGVGLIRLGTNNNPIFLPAALDDLTYEDLVLHRNDWLNISTEEQTLEWIDGPWCDR